MPALKRFFVPSAYLHFLHRKLLRWCERQNVNWRAVRRIPPGHYYSPLLDIESLQSDEKYRACDGEEDWSQIRLNQEEQEQYYTELLRAFPCPAFPCQKKPEFRYYHTNNFFFLSDAFTLSAIIRKEQSRRIIEVGSGFSSAVILDTATIAQRPIELTCIEPKTQRLQSLLSPADLTSLTLRNEPVQNVPLSCYHQLEKGDILFIDSSHVAKFGSDVCFLLFRVLPILKPGVLIHFHDIFYPQAYPLFWLQNGLAWNESLFLRAFLSGQKAYEILAFNSLARSVFPGLFADKFPAFLQDGGNSLWLRKMALL